MNIFRLASEPEGEKTIKDIIENTDFKMMHRYREKIIKDITENTD